MRPPYFKICRYNFRALSKSSYALLSRVSILSFCCRLWQMISKLIGHSKKDYIANILTNFIYIFVNKYNNYTELFISINRSDVLIVLMAKKWQLCSAACYAYCLIYHIMIKNKLISKTCTEKL